MCMNFFSNSEFTPFFLGGGVYAGRILFSPSNILHEFFFLWIGW